MSRKDRRSAHLMNARRRKGVERGTMARLKKRKRRKRVTPEPWPYERPEVRADCKTGIRPCPFVGCKYHLYLDVNPDTGSIKLNFPDWAVWELPDTCCLDIADRGGVTLEATGDALNLTRERIRQIQEKALAEIRAMHTQRNP